MRAMSLEDVKAALVAGGVTGPHRSHTRENNISKIRACIAGDPEGCFGLTGLTDYTEEQVIGFLGELTGCSTDIADAAPYDVIDPVRTVEGIVAAADRLRGEAAKGATLLAATGHPTGMLEHNIRVADAYRAAGGKILRPREEEKLARDHRHPFEVRYVGGVGCLADWGSLQHTHSATAMEALLEVEPWPDVVLGDHGFAGAAIERGIPTIAIMDINDPALAIAWAADKDVVIVPMDDNRPPYLYEPSWTLFEHILAGGEV